MNLHAIDRDGDVLDAVRAMTGTVREHAAEGEATGELAAVVRDRFREAGIFRLLVPRVFGGLERDVSTMVRVVEELAAADGSAGWVAMIGALGGVAAGLFAAATAAKIWGRPDALVVGPITPLGTAVPARTGYVVRGRWPFASACRHASWLLTGCLVAPDDLADTQRRASIDWRLSLLPISEVRIIDTWSVSGLRATGSHDVEVASVLVPREHVIAFGGHPVQPGPLYEFPAQGLLAIGVAAVALGIARGAIDALVQLAGRKTPIGSAGPLARRHLAQVQVAQAEAAVRSARSLLYDEVASAWQALHARHGLDLRERALLRLACTNATASSAHAVDLMYTAGGGTANYTSSPLQRHLRDVHAVTQHLSTAPASQELIGRVLVGLGDDNPLL